MSLTAVAHDVFTAVAFIMAASVSQAFTDDSALWFAIPYVVVRAGGLGIFLAVASEDADRLKGVLRFTLASIPGMVVLIVGAFMDADVRAWFWLAVVVLDIGASQLSTVDGGWRLNVEHFAERRGLFVIIALGESLVVVGVIVAGAERSADLLGVTIGAVVITCLLWWSYFGWLKDALEVQLEREPHETEIQLGRDAFTLLHFPLIGGVIGIAVGFEEMVLHPGEPLETAGIVALALGLVLFVGGGAAAWARAGRQLLLPRLGVLTALVVTLVLAADAQPWVVLTIVAVAIAAIAIVEHVQHPARHILEAE